MSVKLGIKGFVKRFLFAAASVLLLLLLSFAFLMYRSSRARAGVSDFCERVQPGQAITSVQADAERSGLRALFAPAVDQTAEPQQTLLVLDGVGMARHTCSVTQVEGRVVAKTMGFID